MSTLISSPRLPSRPLIVAALITLVGLPAGCSGKPGLRAGGAGPKTFLTLGDRRLPVVSGESGSSVAADVAPIPPAGRGRSDEGRISGRVYDADGRPVSGATVRLALGPASAGRDNRVTTDPSGAFTIRDLRAGSQYTLIAEWEEGDGPVSGRARAATDDTGVRISLAGEAPAASSLNSSVADRPRVDRVSKRDEAKALNDDPAVRYDDPPVVPGRRVAVNEEDLPPAPEAEAFDPLPPAKRDPVSRTAAQPRSGVWQPVGGARRAVIDDGSTVPDDRTSEAGTSPNISRARPVFESSPDGLASPFDEGPSPLPPAVDPAPGQAEGSASVGRRPYAGEFDDSPIEPDPFAEEAPKVARSEPPSRRRTPAPRTSKPVPAEPTRPAREPGALVAVPDSYAPIVLGGGSTFEPPESLEPSNRGQVPPPAPPRSILEADDPFDDPIDLDEGPSAAIAKPRPRESLARAEPEESPAPDWAAPSGADMPELAEVKPEFSEPTGRPALARDEPIITPLGDARPVRRPVAASVDATTPATIEAELIASPLEAPETRPRPTWGEVLSSTGKLPPLLLPEREKSVAASVDPNTRPTGLTLNSPPAEVAPSCSYDDRLRRLIDFQLPDLSGQPTRFKDFDADLVLLDFWGTWCQPCVKSMPHLVDLQKRLGDKKLIVVGVACEQDEPARSAKRVATVAERLKVNYPILLSRNDGSCPLQEALHVQAFPTMVLLDRQGRVLWRDQGATPATLSRLDRMIATATDSGPGTAKVVR